MLAQKQPFIQRVRNSSLVEWLCAENLTGLRYKPKLGILNVSSSVEQAREISSPQARKLSPGKSTVLDEALRVVGERCMRGEVVAKAAVDCIQVRMPE